MRYFFHIFDGTELHPDDVGNNLPNLESAERLARVVADELALLWQIYSRCFCLPIQTWQYGHRRGLDRMMRSTMAWRMAGSVG